MQPQPSHDEWFDGSFDGESNKSLERLFELTYHELKRIAAFVKQSDNLATLNPTALVNEAWVKMSRTPGLGHLKEAEFKLVAARAMRQVTVEYARRRDAQKRQLPDQQMPRLGVAAAEEQVAALDEALKELAVLNRRHAAIVEGRFFGGMTINEVATSLKISPSTVEREWRLARAWLGRRMTQPE